MNTKSLIRIPVAAAVALLVTLALFQQLARLTAPMEFVALPKTVPIDWGRHLIDSGPPPKKEHEQEKVVLPEMEKTGGVKAIGRNEKVEQITPVSFTKGSGLDIPRIGNAGSGLAAGADRSAVPVFRRDPVYPSYAALHNMEGWVRVSFDITATGAVSNAYVVDAEPKGMFEASALKAIASWRYKPQIEDGMAVEQRGMETVIRFQLK